MFNVLLDKLPTEYEGFPIDSDFQTGIQLWQILEDETLSQYEKDEICRELLFLDKDEEGNPIGLPDIGVAIKGVQWFLSEWYKDRADGEDNSRVMDYDIDQWRIYSAFRTQYGVNLNTDKLHFWEFMGLLNTLNECAFTRIVGIRQRELSKNMSQDERKALKKAKERYALTAEEDNSDVEENSDADEEAIDTFMKYVKQGN